MPDDQNNRSNLECATDRSKRKLLFLGRPTTLARKHCANSPSERMRPCARRRSRKKAETTELSEAVARPAEIIRSCSRPARDAPGGSGLGVDTRRLESI
jgi:hypothetical protein